MDRTIKEEIGQKQFFSRNFIVLKLFSHLQKSILVSGNAAFLPFPITECDINSLIKRIINIRMKLNEVEFFRRE